MLTRFFIYTLCATVLSAQTQDVLTNETVLKMVQAGVPTQTIVKTIQTSDHVNFRFSPADLALFGQMNVPEDVFKAMAARDKGQPPAAAAPVVAKAIAPQPAPPAAPTAAPESKPAPSPVSSPSASAISYKVEYDGGSLQDAKAGTGMKVYLDATQIRIMKDRTTVATIPAASVTEISYGQDVHRRVGAAIGLAVISFGIGALMALTKSKKHFIGITWDDAGKKGGLAVQAEKGDYRGLLAGLEGITGKKAVDSDALTVKN